MEELHKVLNEYYKLEINKQIDYDKLYLYSIITHSTAIEGSTITEIENQLLFDEGISSKKPIIEQLMNLDLKNAYEQAILISKSKQEITPKLLCELSSIVMKNTGSTYNTISGKFNSANGDLRLLNVSAGRGGKSYMSWQKVPQKLNDFCNWINEQRNNLSDKKLTNTDKYKLSFEAHYHLVEIHPWADGNGRMSRLIMNLIQYEANLIPSILKKEDKIEYIKSLADAQTNEDKSIFIQFMLNNHIKNIKEQINDYKKSQEKDISINKKKQNNSDYDYGY